MDTRWCSASDRWRAVPSRVRSRGRGDSAPAGLSGQMVGQGHGYGGTYRSRPTSRLTTVEQWLPPLRSLHRPPIASPWRRPGAGHELVQPGEVGTAVASCVSRTTFRAPVTNRFSRTTFRAAAANCFTLATAGRKSPTALARTSAGRSHRLPHPGAVRMRLTSCSSGATSGPRLPTCSSRAGSAGPPSSASGARVPDGGRGARASYRPASWLRCRGERLKPVGGRASAISLGPVLARDCRFGGRG